MRVVFQLIEPLLKRRIEIVHGLESANKDRGWKVLFNARFLADLNSWYCFFSLERRVPKALIVKLAPVLTEGKSKLWPSRGPLGDRPSQSGDAINPARLCDERCAVNLDPN